MKFLSKNIMIAIAAGGLVVSSCSHDTDFYEGSDNGTSEGVNKTKENFKAMVGGDVDPNQTWETAKNVTVSSNLSLSTPIEKVQLLADGKLVGEAASTNGAFGKMTLTVPSYVKSLTAKFVTREGLASSMATTINSDNNVTFGTTSGVRKAATRAESNRTCVEFGKVDKFNYREFLWNDHYQETPSAWPDKYYYVAENAYGEKAVVDNDLLEKVNKIVPENQKSDYYETIVQDVELTTEVAGPVTLKLLSATTSNQAAIGYYFYDSKEVDNTDHTAAVEYDENNHAKTVQYQDTREPKKLANKYVIVPNVKAQDLFTSKTDWVWDETINQSVPVATNTATDVKLLYVDEKTGEVSETFPAGIKIGFFIMPNAGCSNSSYINAQNTAFSLGAMNVDVHAPAVENGPLHIYQHYYSGFDTDEKRAMSHAATFMVDDKVIIGFEDAPAYNSNDFDYNDCIFMVDGTFKPNIPDPVKPQVQKYTYCYEDMAKNGGDYDFNDCVLKVTAPVDGKINVTLAAVGASYSLYAKLGTRDLFGGRELHAVLGCEQGKMVNTESLWVEPYTETIEVGDNWNILTDGNFSLYVEDRGITVQVPTFITNWNDTDKIPYAVCVADDFDYPLERVNVVSKYPNFAGWAKDMNTNLDWYKFPSK